MEQQDCRGKVGQWPQVRKHGANGSQWQCGSCRPSPGLMDLPQGVAPTVSVKQTARALVRDAFSVGPTLTLWTRRAWPSPQQLGHPGNAWVHHANMANHGLLAGYSLQGMTAHGTRAIPFVRGALSPYTLPPQQDKRQKAVNMARPGGSNRLARVLPISLLPWRLLRYCPDCDKQVTR